MEQKYSDTLISSRKDGKLAYTKHLFDIPQELSQEEINISFKSAIAKVADLLTKTIDDISSKWSQHQTDVQNLQKYTNDRTQSILTDYIINSAKKFLD